MKPTRKLSDGILPCGRCGVEPRLAADFFGFYRFFCPACGITEGDETVADGIVAWNKFTAKFHPEPEDYLELLEECCPSVPEFSSADSRCGNHLNIMLDLLTDYGDDDD